MNSCPITKTKSELHNQYSCIFKNGNRNAASHKWASHILSHSNKITKKQFIEQKVLDDKIFCFFHTTIPVFPSSKYSIKAYAIV